MNLSYYTFEVIKNNETLLTVTVKSYEDNAQWLAFKKASELTKVSLYDAKLILINKY